MMILGMKNHMCMWPDRLSKSDPDIVRYLEQLQKYPGNCERYPFRGTHWINDEDGGNGFCIDCAWKH